MKSENHVEKHSSFEKSLNMILYLFFLLVAFFLLFPNIGTFPGKPLKGSGSLTYAKVCATHLRMLNGAWEVYQMDAGPEATSMEGFLDELKSNKHNYYKNSPDNGIECPDKPENASGTYFYKNSIWSCPIHSTVQDIEKMVYRAESDEKIWFWSRLGGFIFLVFIGWFYLRSDKRVKE
ncbi:MAG: hypothetical protein KKB51_10860 [Candidatus Riflebacteria bacterium]|nr:hypothetical protein [Candidatus Riflebacteria bacterium]